MQYYFFKFSGVCVALAATVSAAPFSNGPFDSAFSKRQSPDVSSTNLTVDLGYEVYQGYWNSESGINSWQG